MKLVSCTRNQTVAVLMPEMKTKNKISSTEGCTATTSPFGYVRSQLQIFNDAEIENRGSQFLVNVNKEEGRRRKKNYRSYTIPIYFPCANLFLRSSYASKEACRINTLKCGWSMVYGVKWIGKRVESKVENVGRIAMKSHWLLNRTAHLPNTQSIFTDTQQHGTHLPIFHFIC